MTAKVFLTKYFQALLTLGVLLELRMKLLHFCVEVLEEILGLLDSLTLAGCLNLFEDV